MFNVRKAKNDYRDIEFQWRDGTLLKFGTVDATGKSPFEIWMEVKEMVKDNLPISKPYQVILRDQDKECYNGHIGRTLTDLLTYGPGVERKFELYQGD